MAYLVLADASGPANEGKISLLGIGVRVLRPSVLPAAAQLTLAGAFQGTDDEAGPHPFEIVMIEPDGTENVVLRNETDAGLPAGGDPDFPPQFTFAIQLTRPYTQEGVYRFRVTFGDASAEYPVRVVVVADGKRAAL